MEEAKTTERKSLERSKKRTKKKRTPKSSNTSLSSSSTLREFGEDREKKKKKNRNTFCLQCKLEEHLKEECVTFSTCEICQMYNRAIASYRYNLRDKVLTMNHMEPRAKVYKPRGRCQNNFWGRGRGRVKSLNALIKTC